MARFQELLHKRRLVALCSIGVLAVASIAFFSTTSGGVGGPLSSAVALRRLAYDQTTTTLPSYTDNFEDVWSTMQPTDTPFFWYIPRAGGFALQKIVANCLNLVSASSRGIPNEQSLGVYRLLHENTDLGLYLNVNPGTHDGIDQCADLDVIGSGMADVLFTHHLVYSEKLFNASYNARIFTMIRNPVKRSIDQFYYRQRATWDPNFDPDLARMNLNQYAYSDKFIANFMVRSLVNVTDTVNVTQDDVDTAKQILRQKFLIGITEWYDRSIIRFEKYFGWYTAKDVASNRTTNYCHYRKIRDGNIYGRHVKWKENQEPTKRIKNLNWADMELYAYAKWLFRKQAELVL